jgi:CheY-like chemotaxis protein
MEPFFTTKGVGKGTGLGLSMVHGLAEQSGGKLLLRSEKGVGTTAEIWLPVATPASRAADHDLPVVPKDAGIDASSLTVLVVDDDNLVRMSTVAMLEDLGYSVLDAGSGKQALATLRHEKSIDLVITDQAMPNMTGVQLADAIQSEWPSLPIIIASGYAEVPLGTQSGLLKLAKPFHQDALVQAINDAVRAK